MILQQKPQGWLDEQNQATLLLLQYFAQGLGLGEEVFSTADALCNTCNNGMETSVMLPGFDYG